MRSMDPALEESSRVLGASKLRDDAAHHAAARAARCARRKLVRLRRNAECFRSALSFLGSPERFYVLTTAIWQSTLSFPPNYGRAAAMGVALFVIMAIMLWAYRKVISTRKPRDRRGQSLPSSPPRHGRARLGAFCGVHTLRAGRRGAAYRCPDPHLVAGIRNRHHFAEQILLCELTSRPS